MLRFISSVWGNFKEYFVLILLLVISFISLSLNQNPAIKKVRAIAFGSFAASTAILSDIVNIAKVKSENERLREINAELMLQVNKLREYGVVNENLRKMIGLKDTLKYTLIPALTVSKSFTIAQGTITLNAGSDNGVKPGMPVINEKGLVGIIYATSKDFSIARTLKNFELKLVVKDERSRVDGVLKWNGEDLVIVNVPKTTEVSSVEIREALNESIIQIVDAVKQSLERTPPELSADILDRGVMITGGGALLKGLDERIRMETSLPVHVAEDPLTAVVRGAGKVIENLNHYSKVLIRHRRY